MKAFYEREVVVVNVTSQSTYPQRWATATLLIASLLLPLFVKFNSGAITPVTE